MLLLLNPSMFNEFISEVKRSSSKTICSGNTHGCPIYKKEKEARRTKLTTANLNLRNYARCEWKCLAFIGTDDSGKFYHVGANCNSP